MAIRSMSATTPSAEQLGTEARPPVRTAELIPQSESPQSGTAGQTNARDGAGNPAGVGEDGREMSGEAKGDAGAMGATF